MRMTACVRLIAIVLLSSLLAHSVAAEGGSAAQSRFFMTSDGVRLHYLEAGPPTGHTMVFVPGWTMPAWIWGPQIQAFRAALPRRGVRPARAGRFATSPPSGYEPVRRGQDIAELIAHLEPCRCVLVGWSLGVLDTLAYVQQHGDRTARRAGAGGQFGRRGAAAARRRMPRPRRRRRPPRDVAMRRFVRGMFRTPADRRPIWTG